MNLNLKTVILGLHAAYPTTTGFYEKEYRRFHCAVGLVVLKFQKHPSKRENYLTQSHIIISEDWNPQQYRCENL